MTFLLLRKKTDEEKAAAAARADESRRLKELEKAAKRQEKEARARDARARKEAKKADKQARKALAAADKQAKKELAALEKQAQRAHKLAERERKLAARKAKRARAKEDKQRRRRERRRHRPRPQGAAAELSLRPAAPRFAKRDHCHACARNFTATRRRHHCRLCRASCCLACVAATRRPVYGKRRPQKVCVVCDVLVFSPSGDAPEPAAVAPPASAAALPAPRPVEQAPAGTDDVAGEALAAPLVRLAVHGRATRRPNSAPLPSRPTGRAAPVVRVASRRPTSSKRPSRWMGLKRKASDSLLRWGDPIPVGRKRLDLHLAKTAELLAQGPSRALELRVEQPHEGPAVAV